MKFLIQSLGWEEFVNALNAERVLVGPISFENDLPEDGEPLPLHSKSTGLKVLQFDSTDTEFATWLRDSVLEHKHEGFRGVHLRLKLGDITSDRARFLARIARQFSFGRLRTSIGQNIYLPWVREESLFDLYRWLRQIELGEPGVDSVQDVTTCPGSELVV